VRRSHRIAVAAGLLCLSALPVSAQPARTKILLDTDIGTDIDDAWALGYALNSPTLDLLGVTTSDGDTAARARLACKLLYRLGRTDVPVAVGRATPAVPADRIDFQFAWAEDFRGYAPVTTPAVEFLANAIRKNPHQITLVAVGPLFNIGDLIRLHPDVVPLVKRVVLMSGSIGANAYGPGPVAEWNVKLAIQDAQAVYAAEGEHAADRGARDAAAALDGSTRKPDDAARSARARGGAGAGAFLRTVRIDAGAGRPRRLHACGCDGRTDDRGLPRAEAQRVHDPLHRAALDYASTIARLVQTPTVK
jgi:hypothetical protein